MENCLTSVANKIRAIYIGHVHSELFKSSFSNSRSISKSHGMKRLEYILISDTDFISRLDSVCHVNQTMQRPVIKKLD